jgi:hypothetical protein
MCKPYKIVTVCNLVLRIGFSRTLSEPNTVTENHNFWPRLLSFQITSSPSLQRHTMDSPWGITKGRPSVTCSLPTACWLSFTNVIFVVDLFIAKQTVFVIRPTWLLCKRLPLTDPILQVAILD